MATLQQVLGARNLIRVIQAVKPGIPTEQLPQSFLTATRPIEGDYGTYRMVTGTRKVARLARYGAPSKLRELQGIAERPVKLLHTVESENFSPTVLQNLTNLGDEAKQRLGQAEIARQTKNFKDLFQNLRVAATYSTLANGAVYFDINGELLPNSTGAATTVDMLVPSGNKSQLNVFGDGDIVTASWATVGTSILAQVKKLKRSALRLTGYPLKHVFYGSAVLPYIVNNTELKDYAKRNPGYQMALLSDEIPAGFLGLTWHPVDEAFFATNAGPTAAYQAGTSQQADATVELWPAARVVFTPEPSPDWYEVLEGSYPVPTSVDEAEDAEKAAANLMTVQGMFAYAYVTRDPVGIKEVAGDTFLPLFNVPAAVFQADVAF